MMSGQAGERARQLVLHESRLAEEGAFDEWLELWDEDGLYWIPTGAGDDPDDLKTSIVRDRLPELRERIARLQSGLVHSQVPPSRWVRIWGPLSTGAVEASREHGPGEQRDLWRVRGNFHIVEVRRDRWQDWAGTAEYLIRSGGSQPRIYRKTVMLVNRDGRLPPLMFLI